MSKQANAPVLKAWERDPEYQAYKAEPFRICPNGILHYYVGWGFASGSTGHTTRQHTPHGPDGDWAPPRVRTASWMRATTPAGILAEGIAPPC